jgi:hypothetical protein
MPNSRWFKNLLYVLLMLKSLMWLYNSSLFFSEPTLSFIQPQFVNTYSYPAFVLFLSQNHSLLGPLFSVMLLILSLFQLLKPRTYLLFDGLIWLLLINLHLFNYSTLSGGDALLNNLCFFNIFLLKQSLVANTVLKQLRVAAHNASFAALIVQVCLVYLFSAIAKWADADWLNGEAVYVVYSAPQYSRAFLIHHADVLHPLSLFLSYFVLVYQSAFPLGVFWKPLKRWFIPIGILMHLYIAFVMGLFFFGLTMALAYVLFYNFKSSEH